MKLFARYSRINVFATVIIFLIASIAFFFTLQYVFLNQIDEDLKIEEKEILTFITEHGQPPENISVSDQVINYEKVTSSTDRYFATKSMNVTGERAKEKFRQLVFGFRTAGQWYRVTVSKSLEETQNLARSVLIITFTTILVILLVAFIINRVVLKKIWRPFYKSLNAVEEFRVGSDQHLQLPSSRIDEFELMNKTLEKLTNTARVDYLSLKTFSENASHEIQTPLAVIRSKLDLMVQDENLTEKQSELLQAVYDSVQKLANLNHSLLLLAKIENNQFDETKPIDLREKVQKKMADFHEFWLAQELGVHSELNDSSVFANEELLDVLLNNLFSNATRHNYRGGKMNIILDRNFLMIENTGSATALDPQKLYMRFTKLSNGSGNNGLGLSVIRQICDTSGFTINYSFRNDAHAFTISWN